jgi:hypothetical protein
MSGIATAIVGSAVVGGIVASNSASKAANAQKDAAQLASNTELEQYRQNREDMQPWREAGQGALKQMTEGTAAGGDFNRDFTLSDFTQDPGYQFRMDQGTRALESSAAARGGALGGGALKGLARYGQDYASGEYQNAYNRFNNDRTQRFNRLASLAGVGQTATRDVAQQGAQVASNVGNNIIGAGNAQASSYVGQGNAISGAAQTLGNFAMNKYYLSQMPGRTSTMPTTPSGGSWTGGWGSGGDVPVYG